jgi:hypothetical protein
LEEGRERLQEGERPEREPPPHLINVQTTSLGNERRSPNRSARDTRYENNSIARRSVQNTLPPN